MGRRSGRDNAVREWVKPGDFLARKLVKDSIGEKIEDLERRIAAQEFSSSGAPSLDYLSGDIGLVPYGRSMLLDMVYWNGGQDDIGTWRPYKLAGFNTREIRFHFTVPADYKSMISMQLIIIADTTETIQFDLYSNYGKDGEDYNQYAETSLNVQKSVIANKMDAIDVEGVFTYLEAGHHGVLRLVSDTDFIWVTHVYIVYEV